MPHGHCGAEGTAVHLDFWTLRGLSIGRTDDYCYNVEEDPVHIHDVQATILNCLGVDHTKLTYKFQGRYFRLTDIAGNVVTKALA